MFSLVGVIGVGLVTGSLVLTALFASITWLIQRIVIGKEEVFLHEMHGERYDIYLRNVPRLCPDISLWQSGDQITVSTRGVLTTFVDASLFLLAMPIAEALGYLREAKIVPVMLELP